MKLQVVRYAYEPPALEIIPETDYEAAVLNRYWDSIVVSKGRASPESQSANGFSYTIKFVEPKQGVAIPEVTR